MVFFRDEILDLIFENDLGKNLDKTFDGEFGSSFSEVRKKVFSLNHNFIDYLNDLHFIK